MGVTIRARRPFGPPEPEPQPQRIPERQPAKPVRTLPPGAPEPVEPWKQPQPVPERKPRRRIQPLSPPKPAPTTEPEKDHWNERVYAYMALIRRMKRN